MIEEEEEENESINDPYWIHPLQMNKYKTISVEKKSYEYNQGAIACT